MLSDRLVKIFLGAVCLLLAALLLQATLNGSREAEASIYYPNTDKIYSTKLVSEFAIDDIVEVIPMQPDGEGVNFLVRTEKTVRVYRCAVYVPETRSDPPMPTGRN